MKVQSFLGFLNQAYLAYNSNILAKNICTCYTGSWNTKKEVCKEQ
jgi:hypothetical protein